MLLPSGFPFIMESWYTTGVPDPVGPPYIEEIHFRTDTSGITDGTSDFNGERYGLTVQSAWLE